MPVLIPLASHNPKNRGLADESADLPLTPLENPARVTLAPMIAPTPTAVVSASTASANNPIFLGVMPDYTLAAPHGPCALS